MGLGRAEVGGALPASGPPVPGAAQAGDRLLGAYQPGTGAPFSLRGRTVGAVAGPEFARLFFGVWPAPLAFAPQLRAALRGTRAQGPAKSRASAPPQTRVPP